MSYGEDIQVVAGQDLSSLQFMAVGIGGTIVATNTLAVGAVQNKPKSGEDCAARFWGRGRFKSGGTVTAGNRFMVTTSGFFIACASNQFGVGTALTTVASGGIFSGLCNFIGAKSTVGSAHLT